MSNLQFDLFNRLEWLVYRTENRGWLALQAGLCKCLAWSGCVAREKRPENSLRCGMASGRDMWSNYRDQRGPEREKMENKNL